jgi:hypothetical protein
MGPIIGVVLFTLSFVLAGLPVRGWAADGTGVEVATRQVSEGARKIGDGQVLAGTGELAKGLGNTVVEGAKYTGATIAETGERAWNATVEVAGEVAKLPRRLWNRVRTF